MATATATAVPPSLATTKRVGKVSRGRAPRHDMGGDTRIIVTENVNDYRALIPRVVGPQDIVLEVGGSLLFLLHPPTFYSPVSWCVWFCISDLVHVILYLRLGCVWFCISDLVRVVLYLRLGCVWFCISDLVRVVPLEAMSHITALTMLSEGP